MTTRPIIIIGTGLAGYHLAKEYRKLNTTAPLVIITQEEGHFYSKPQLSTAFQYAKTPDDLIVTPGHKMAEQLQATLYTHSRVQKIEPHHQRIEVSTPDGAITLEYDKLVLALGAHPKSLPALNGIEHFQINHWQDYRLFREKVSNSDSITIIGSGLVGCEFAHDFSGVFSRVNLITPDPYPLYGLIPKEIGHSLQQSLIQKGVHWINASLQHALLHNDIITLICSDGTTVQTNRVVSAIGITPHTALAQAASIAIRHGIVVNAYLETTNPAIYAIGDCAEIEGQCRQFVAPLLQSTRALAQTLHGNRTAVKFPSFPITLKTASYPTIIMPPSVHQTLSWVIESENNNHKAHLVDDEDTLLGYVLTGKCIEERQSHLALLGAKTPMRTNCNG